MIGRFNGGVVHDAKQAGARFEVSQTGLTKRGEVGKHATCDGTIDLDGVF